jgi:hypothetical protein
LLNLIEEPLDQIPGAIKIRAEADWIVAIASWRNVGPNAPLGGKGADPVGIITTVGQQHCSRLHARQEFACEPVVVRLTGCQREPDRQAVGIDQCVNLAGQTAA